MEFSTVLLVARVRDKIVSESEEIICNMSFKDIK